MTDNLEQLIKEAVEKALEGDMDAVNNIEDRVTRSKAKAALVKAKREAAKEETEANPDENSIDSSDSKQAKTTNEHIAELLIQQFPDDMRPQLLLREAGLQTLQRAKPVRNFQARSGPRLPHQNLYALAPQTMELLIEKLHKRRPYHNGLFPGLPIPDQS